MFCGNSPNQVLFVYYQGFEGKFIKSHLFIEERVGKSISPYNVIIQRSENVTLDGKMTLGIPLIIKY